MQRQLTAIVESLDAAQRRVRALGDGLSADDWKRRPAPDHWSAADCVEHLNLTTKAFLPLIRDALASAREDGPTSVSRYRRDALGWFMSLMIGPMRRLGPVRIARVKTTPPFTPKGKQSRERLLSEFVALQADLVTLVRAADGLPIDQVKIVSPFGGRMKYNTYSAMTIIARHEHRHLQQAEEAALSRQ